MSSPSSSLLLIVRLVLLSSVSATEFIYNIDFNSTNLHIFGNATIQSSSLTLTNNTFSIGRAFYPYKIPTKTSNSSNPLPFSTSFIFSIAPVENLLPGHGFVFIFSPSTGTSGVSSAQHLGLFNLTNDGNPKNHVFGIEFDVFKNQEFNDIDDNHVGVDINSLTSFTSHAAGFWGGKGDGKFKTLKLNNGENYQVWIDYLDSRINVTMAKAGQKRPQRPLISEVVNISEVLLDELHVGFCGATGQLAESHRILAWSFSNSNFSIGDALVTTGLPSFVLQKGSVFGSTGFIVGVSVGAFFVIGFGVMVFVLLFGRKRRKANEEEGIEEWESEYWPHRIGYEEINAATNGFSEENVIGFGGNGKVHKGVLQGVEVAVKRIRLESEDGTRQFLAEISSLGRLKHRNLVALRGWCKKETGSLILVYDYMVNGSLDNWIFYSDDAMMLSWEQRINILKGVAHGLVYLHEGSELKVLHRDIKASNVLLDKDMNARLGDFGLARIYHREQMASTTQVIGTVGYMAPELVRTGRASALTDVFGFGVLLLEVICGRRPTEENKPDLIAWVWTQMERGELCAALDDRLKSKGEYSINEVERMLHLGLLCAYPDPIVRPTMRQVVKVLDRENGGNESEEEGIEVNLLDKINSAATSSWYARNFDHRDHPTFDDIINPLPHYSSTTTLSGSDVLWHGR
ncbi:putative Kinase [Quillaja saponaria]|uniref:non-specific serine/threonine protein kinase n=1 Tax=Quillaja saponaria TaxID=32244 RepID=A0AAD7VMU4_QUISA|nr:putative Kinase [Quillaja saponaria]